MNFTGKNPTPENIVSVHQLFERQCAETPHSIAIQFAEERITYRDLNEKAEQLSICILAEYPTFPIIGISTTRSIEMIIGVLAILKSGKAYLPLDPHLPKDRLAQMVSDSGVLVCITPIHEISFFENLGLEILKRKDLTTIQPALNFQQGSLAYVLYTSGSSGVPKGVCMGHTALVNLLIWQRQNSKAGKSSTTLQFAPLSFDVSFQEIFATLITGGLLILIEDDLRVDPYELLQIIERCSIHRLFLPFIALQQLTEIAQANNLFPASLQEIITAGEQLKITPQVSQFFSMLPGCTLYNQYGPTEAHVVTALKLTGSPADWPSLPSIGKPIHRTEIFILDDKLNVLPDGEIGELCISGICLAEGYLNNKELTNEKFITYKNSLLEEVRIYRTGDLARYLPNGNIEFLGRKDDQVKIRGHRVELAEVEFALNRVHGIEQAFVTVREDIPGQKRLVAYLHSSKGIKDTASVRESIQKSLPDYMIPAAFVWLDQIPKTSSGKVNKKALPKPESDRPELSTLYKAPKSETEIKLATIWSQLFQISKIGVEDNFFELGGNSLLAVKLVIDLKQELSFNFPVTRLYQHPTIKGIATYLANNQPGNSPNIRSKSTQSDIAVVGMAGRFPGADSVEELWKILKEGKETIRFFKDEELHFSIPDPIKNNPCYVKARGIISNADTFDSSFFGINPKVAELMDPQQRVFLEIASEVLEQTGHLPNKYNGSIGVFAGCGNNTYYHNNVLPNKELIDNVGSFQVMTLNEKDYIATRVAYHLNLKGPAVSIYSGCSTSLLAIAQAAESIRNGRCDVALAGGVAIHSPINSGQLYEEGAMFSPDGHCKPFDREAKGTVFSDGAGVVLLKRLDDAIRDNDTIYAVLKGIGYNNDGAGKASFTAPSAQGQAGAIVQAINDAGIKALDISYIETHGTATPIGDPIEIDGLSLAFGNQERKQFCAIGSLKSNLGHLTAAAGVAGFIKTTLCLYNKQLPATLHYEEANPNIHFANTPFYVNAKFKDWESNQLRIAGVSSFGVGGTNVHVILEEFKKNQEGIRTSKPFTLIKWSAKAESSRDAYAKLLHQYIKNNNTVEISDIAFTLNTTRESHNFRSFTIAANAEELSKNLHDTLKLASSSRVTESVDEIAFLFPGQGSQYQNMGSDLYLHESIFKEAVDLCAELLQQEINLDIRTILFSKNKTDNKYLNNTFYTQPALFTIEYALAKLWMSWGITPSILLGHSIGEFVAGHLAGIFSLQDCLKLVAARARLMSELKPGKMLSVSTTEHTLRELLPTSLSVAAVNTSKSCVVAGTCEDIEKFAATLKSTGIGSRLLNTSHAFHSSMMEEIVKPFQKIVESIKLTVPKIPIVSTVTGKRLTEDDATNAYYWAKQLRATVRFGDALNNLVEDQNRILLEVGPGNVTTTLARQQLKAVSAIGGMSRDNKGESEYYQILQSLGQIWLYGFEPDWKLFHTNQPANRISLPTYAFNALRCWVEPPDIFLRRQDEISPIVNTLNNGQHLLVPIKEDNLPQIDHMRKQTLVKQIKQILEDASGIEMQDVPEDIHFMEIGLDSLSLTQISLSLKKKYSLPITFRQLVEEYNTVSALSSYLDLNLPEEKSSQPTIVSSPVNSIYKNNTVRKVENKEQNDSALHLISEQIRLLARQVAVLQGEDILNTPTVNKGDLGASILSPEEEVEIKKPFGATARIQKQSTAVTEIQKKFIENFTEQYNRKTKQSKAYTQKHRSYMADPRVVSGFNPLVKEMIYPIVVNKSKGSTLWDIDGNEYIDVLNGFGSNLLGYQNEAVKKAVQDQIENGYEIGPQHELAGEVCKLICEFTSFDRAALCNTGSEAVLGAIRIARTVTGRSTIVSFNGSYHGIVDEVIVRGSKKMKSFPAAPGIMPEAVQNILVLEYGTEESLRIIKEKANELAAVLVEPVQSRRPEFVPIDFLKELRKITHDSGTALIFDEVITGFRMHAGGVQAIFDIQADLGTYGKVVAGGMPIGVIAGKKDFMDALDGGYWQYGDSSVPEAGVTYFAGTFVRHPLALAAAKASLDYMKIKGPALQAGINSKTKRLADEMNRICEQYALPLYIAQFGSLWKIKFKNEVPYGETLFSLMRYKGIHIWDLFPCFITEAHTDADIETVIEKFKESILELIKAQIFQPGGKIEPINGKYKIQEQPPVPGAKLGRDINGNAAWFMTDPERPGKYLQLQLNEN